MAEQVVIVKKVTGPAQLSSGFIDTSGYSKARIQTYGTIARGVNVYSVAATLQDSNPNAQPTPDISSQYLIGFQGASGAGWKTLLANVDFTSPYIYVEVDNYAGSSTFTIVVTLQE